MGVIIHVVLSKLMIHRSRLFIYCGLYKTIHVTGEGSQDLYVGRGRWYRVIIF